jgi:hypothetical protein
MNELRLAQTNRARRALLQAKQQIRRALADYDARVAAAPVSPLVRVGEPPQPGPGKQVRRRRCDARIKHSQVGLDRARRAGPAVLRRYLRQNRCRNWALSDSARCRLHGGHSTGPVTAEGKARTVEAMKAGRARWLAELKAEGKPIPCGRKKSSRNRSIEERAQAAWEEQCMREWRDACRLSRHDRKSRRQHERAVAADLARRRDRFNAGLPFWTDEEWKNL